MQFDRTPKTTSSTSSHCRRVSLFNKKAAVWTCAKLRVAPPRVDRWGPGNRVPALIISPYARKGTVDHTLYDTTSITRFITRRFDLPMLDGLKARATEASGQRIG